MRMFREESRSHLILVSFLLLTPSVRFASRHFSSRERKNEFENENDLSTVGEKRSIYAIDSAFVSSENL